MLYHFSEVHFTCGITTKVMSVVYVLGLWQSLFLSQAEFLCGVLADRHSFPVLWK
jgi:hypothetical protein